MNRADDWEEIDPDYGVFGDPGGLVPRTYRVPEKLTPRQVADRERVRQQRERDRSTSSNFNRHMIDLYNQGQRR